MRLREREREKERDTDRGRTIERAERQRNQGERACDQESKGRGVLTSSALTVVWSDILRVPVPSTSGHS